MTRLTDGALSEFERWASGVEKSPAVHPPAGLFLASNVRALVGEVRRQRRLLGAASAFVVGSDGYCRACGRSALSVLRGDGGHEPGCISAEIEREAGA